VLVGAEMWWVLLLLLLLPPAVAGLPTNDPTTLWPVV
jgi:hypothetical protein